MRPPNLPFSTCTQSIPHARHLGPGLISKKTVIFETTQHSRVFPHDMAAPPPPPKGGGLSLYANLLDPKADSQATVSGAPVVYDSGKKDDAAVKKEANQGQ